MIQCEKNEEIERERGFGRMFPPSLILSFFLHCSSGSTSLVVFIPLSLSASFSFFSLHLSLFIIQHLSFCDSFLSLSCISTPSHSFNLSPILSAFLLVSLSFILSTFFCSFSLTLIITKEYFFFFCEEVTLTEL